MSNKNRVFILNFFEHLPNPNITLKGISNNLNDDGIGLIEVPNFDLLKNLKKRFNFYINHKVLTATLPENNLQKLLTALLKDYKANSISFEDLPVDDTMRNFFQNPDKQ